MRGRSMAWTVIKLKLMLVAAVALVWFLGMRFKWTPVIDFQRRLNRDMMNDRQMKDAGKVGAYAAVIRHTGRTSGKPYETPVVPFPAGDDKLLIALPYGAGTDWVKNVLASGHAEIVHEGETFAVDQPVVRKLEAGDVPKKEARLMKAFNNTECLEVHRAS